MSDTTPEFHNPFESPRVASAPVPEAVSDAEATRKKYLAHEASVQSIGFLYIIGSVFLLLAAASYLGIAATSGVGPATGPTLSVGSALFYMLLGSLQLATGIGLRKLKPWARIVASLLSAIGLLGIPIGTIISIYILYLLLSKKGSVVFSSEYQSVVAATPHIKYKTSKIVLVFLGLLVLLIVIGIAAYLVGV